MVRVVGDDCRVDAAEMVAVVVNRRDGFVGGGIQRVVDLRQPVAHEIQGVGVGVVAAILHAVVTFVANLYGKAVEGVVRPVNLDGAAVLPRLDHVVPLPVDQ